MDLDEWEILSDGGLVDHLHEDQSKSKLKNTTLIDMDYFHNSTVIDEEKEDEIPEEEEEIPEEEVIKLPLLLLPIESSQDEQEMISKQFVDMKSDVGCYQFDEKDGKFEKKIPENEVGSYQFVKKDEKIGAFEVKNPEKDEVMKMEEEGGDENGGVKIWKWAMTGMGALVTFGFAAATVSLIVFSNKHKDGKNSKNQDLHFQIYSHDKRFKQVVRRAKRLNEAISVMRGAPMTRAHITIGGYYEAL